MKKISVIITISVMFLSGCAAIQDTYKPLYQVKPEVKQLKGQ
jgi:PBP1b-binding outer membrane lipoprotein LpoB